jgi:hypothetical protein
MLKTVRPQSPRAIAAGLEQPGPGAVDADGAEALQLVIDAGEPGDQLRQSGAEEEMQVLPLRHMASGLRGVLQNLSFQDDDLVQMVSESPRTQ